MPFQSINPASGVLLKEFPSDTDEQAEAKLARAQSVFGSWKQSPVSERCQKLERAAALLDAEKQSIGLLMTREMGKPLPAAVAEVEKCALACRHYAEHAPAYLRDQPVETNASRSFIRYQPLGPVLAIMPWNFPLWQVFRFAAPALAAGNVGLLKHAPSVPQCALLIEDLLLRAGFPEGAFQSLFIESERVAAVLADKRIVAATLTGSERAGSSVASIAGHNLKKTVLELGGSDPFIVMPSGANNATAVAAAKARCINNGQSCIAAKRFIVADAAYDQFASQFVDAMRALTVGDPEQPATDIGPLATEKILEGLEDQVGRAIAAGARALTGGSRRSGPGNFYEPTILVDVPRDSSVYYEELFGPVAMLFRVQNLDEAIELANDSPFGLGASAWTSDEAEQEQFMTRLEAGQVFINSSVASDPRLPFGGIKRSGYGRELAELGLHEFVNIKTIWVK